MVDTPTDAESYEKLTTMRSVVGGSFLKVLIVSLFLIEVVFLLQSESGVLLMVAAIPRFPHFSTLPIITCLKA